MIVKEDFLKKLRASFDLNEYEVKIWTALLSRGVASAGELAEISNVPRSRSYDVLETLEKKGFIIMKLGKPIKYMAVKPEEILRRVKNNVQKRAQEQVKSLEEVRRFKDTNECQSCYLPCRGSPEMAAHAQERGLYHSLFKDFARIKGIDLGR